MGGRDVKRLTEMNSTLKRLGYKLYILLYISVIFDICPGAKCRSILFVVVSIVSS